MSLKLSDFKKTVRGNGEARQIYPHQIRDDRYTAAIGYALSYYERMVGRRRAEFEVETLLEFFGDPKLARGLVACLATTYAWLSPDLADVLGADPALALRRAGVGRPAELRGRLYTVANAHFGGFVPLARRREALLALVDSLQVDAEGAYEWTAGAPAASAPTVAGSLSPELVERALTLDADEERVLVRQGPTPTPDEVVARYNYHSLETALCYAERVTLSMSGPIWAMLRSAHNLARRYRIGYSVGDMPGSLFDERLELSLVGRRDALGGWGRAGRRLARAVLRLLAAHPGCASEGRAVVHIGGKRALLKLDARALAVLGASAEAETADIDAWEDSAADELQRAWSRAQSRGRTAGWGLRRDPEPLVGAESIVVPDFAIRSGGRTAALCLATGRAAAEALAESLARLGPSLPVVVLAPAPAAPLLRRSPAAVIAYGDTTAEAVPQLVRAVENAFDTPSTRPARSA